MEILFDLMKPSNAISGAFVFGPLVSSDLMTTCFWRTSYNIIGYPSHIFSEIYKEKRLYQPLGGHHYEIQALLLGIMELVKWKGTDK